MKIGDELAEKPLPGKARRFRRSLRTARWFRRSGSRRIDVPLLGLGIVSRINNPAPS